MHLTVFPPLSPVPVWFHVDTTIPLEYRESATAYDWSLYRSEPLGRCRQRFHLRRLKQVALNLQQYVDEHSSQQESGDSSEQRRRQERRPVTNDNVKRKRTMDERFADVYKEAEPTLDDLYASLDITMFQFKRVLKKYASTHK